MSVEQAMDALFSLSNYAYFEYRLASKLAGIFIVATAALGIVNQSLLIAILSIILFACHLQAKQTEDNYIYRHLKKVLDILVKIAIGLCVEQVLNIIFEPNPNLTSVVISFVLFLFVLFFLGQ